MSPNTYPFNDQGKGKSYNQETFSIPARDLFDLLDVNHNSGDSFELETASTSTLSDNPGPGYTIGKWIGRAGKKLEVAAGSFAERLRIGPNAVMEDIIDVLSGVGRHHRSLLRPPRPFRSLIPIALSHSTTSPMSSGESVSKIQARLPEYYRKLADYLLDNNPNNQFLALYYITTLIYTDPRARTIFIDLGVFDILQRRQKRLLSLPRRHPHRDLLLAPSRRALVSLAESETLTVIQSLDYGGRSDPELLPDHRAESIATLIQFTMMSDHQILAGLRISKLERIVHAHPTLLEAIKPEVVYQWAELSQSDDPILSHVYSRILSQFASVCSDICCARLWDCYVVPVCQSYFDTIGVDESAGRIINRILPNKNYLAALLTPEIRSKLPKRSMALTQTHRRSTTEILEWPSLVQLFAGSFFSLWGAFLRQWMFKPGEARHDFYHNISSEPWDIPSRRLSPKIRTSLCRQLVTIAVNSECSVEDVIQVANEDVDCYDEILGNLGQIVDNGDQSARASALAIKLDLEAWYKKRASEKPHTFWYATICEGVCVDDPLQPNSRGKNKAFWSSSRMGCERQYKDDLALYIDSHYVAWVKAPHLPSISALYRPVTTKPSEDDPEELIACILEKTNGVKIIFSISQDLVVPDTISVISTGPLYILMARPQQDGAEAFYWGDPCPR
ncbi:hypothetical protein JAAARDRAFT_32890 [Jaapia argillacea MUCL 33604]|uniref:Uncharacterized protein n=1 Tax=Jaapia argillacea MUCL 33604 TaxID=933084 RepID=A0A067QAF6_9AGAM|nr:hypothetical protein JAAARDRAFT_32890 [Jaapia argillacea MUCL 33604]